MSIYLNHSYFDEMESIFESGSSLGSIMHLKTIEELAEEHGLLGEIDGNTPISLLVGAPWGLECFVEDNFLSAACRAKEIQQKG